jgi:hypothetical protein
VSNVWRIRKATQWPTLFRFLEAVKIPKSGLEVRWGPPRRTSQQNKYYWEVVVPMVAEHLTEKHRFPYTKDMAHDLLKSQFLPVEFQWTDPASGRMFYGSTTKLKRSGEGEDTWQKYTMKIQHWSAQSGLYIPDPKE